MSHSCAVLPENVVLRHAGMAQVSSNPPQWMEEDGYFLQNRSISAVSVSAVVTGEQPPLEGKGFVVKKA